ncbi:MAG: N-acetyltransferase [Planctomycetes bacterium]|nr:N-acetyltransferase [Planctomycetota bacterium]
MLVIREEKPEDIAGIRLVNESAFEQPAEANIIDKLRQNCDGLLSLVAIDGDDIIGHVLFSPAVIDSEHGMVIGMGLAPMAVVPQRQRQGIGTALIKHGIARLRECDCPFVIVLGHAEYYPRFGFKPACQYGLRSQWKDVPDEAFMVMVLDENAMQGISGVARYKDEFDEAM